MNGTGRGAQGRRKPRIVTGIVVAAAALAMVVVALEQRSTAPQAAAAPMLIHVRADGRGDVPTLTEAVARASYGATIFLGPGRYVLERPLDVFRSLAIQGAGAAGTRVVSDARGRVIGFSGNGNLSLDGITFVHVADHGATIPADVAVVLGGHVAFSACRFTGGAADPKQPGTGAGLRLAGGAGGTVLRCVIDGNAGAGVVRHEPTSVRIATTTLRDNGRPGVQRVVQPGPTDPAAFGRWLDGVVEPLLAERHIPGAEFVLVRGGRVFYAKGWGYADAARRTPMDPATTRVRVGSVSKVVTALTVMQLWERRRLDLRDDVDSYLTGFALPHTYPQPVTVGDLLTHSGGLDDSETGSAARSPGGLVPLTTYLSRHVAARIAPPGDVFSYSNYDAALAGAVVERVGGQPFATYVQREVLDPLGMSSSTFAPPATPSPVYAVGYRLDGDKAVARPFDYLNAAPAAGLVTTGVDMGRLMETLLGRGGAGAGAVVSPSTLRVMETEQYADLPGLPGVTYGLLEQDDDLQLALRHNGDWGGFSSMVFLMPSQRLGFFLVDNGSDGGLRDDLVSAFSSAYYPQQVAIGSPPYSSAFAAEAPLFTGTYRLTRYAHGTFEKLLEFSPHDELTVHTDGQTLVLDGVRYARVDTLLFRQVGGDDQIGFAVGSGGHTSYLFVGPQAYRRLAWYQTFRANAVLVLAMLVVFVVTLVYWPGWLLVRKLGGRRRRGWRRGDTARTLAAAASGLDLAFLVAIAMALAWTPLLYGVPWWLVALLIVPNLAVVATAALVVFCVLVFRRRYFTAWGRGLYVATTVASVAFVWFCAEWNLLGLKL